MQIKDIALELRKVALGKETAKDVRLIAADKLEAVEAENARLREALSEIANRHIPDQSAASGGDELDWAIRQYTELRAIARCAVKQENSDAE